MLPFVAAGIDALRVNDLWVERFHGNKRIGLRSSISKCSAPLFVGAIVLFTPGTFIATERGQRPIELLRRGERIVTRSNGLKPVFWIGRCDISYETLNSSDDIRPVLIKKGALGKGRPERDMLVSPHHRFEVRVPSQLKSAKDMIDHRRIVPAPALGVSYLHFMCAKSEVILANGAWSECFHPNDVTQTKMDSQRQEVLRLFPEVETMGAAKRIKPTRQIKAERSRFET